MADYEANPQVTKPGYIRLYGNEYRLMSEEDGSPGHVRVVMSTVPPPKVVTGGDYGKDDQPTLSTHSWSDLRGGMGLWRYRAQELLTPEAAALQQKMFWTSQNMETLTPTPTLGPLATSIGKPTGATSVFESIESLSNTLVAVVGDAGGVRTSYAYTGTWGAGIDTLPNAVRASLRFNGRLFYAVGNSGYSYQTSATSIFTDVAAPTAVAFAVWDGRLYALNLSGTLFSSTSGDALSWTTLATLPIVALTTATDAAVRLQVYRDSDGQTVLWAVTYQGVFIYDAVNDKWIESELRLPESREVGVALLDISMVYQNSLYMRTRGRTMLRLTMASNALFVEEVTPGLPSGVPSSSPDYEGIISGLDSDHKWLFSTMSRADDVVFVYNGLGWHNLFYRAASLPVSNASARARILVAPAVTDYRFYFSKHDGTDDFSLSYLNLDELATNPLVGGTKNYAASGNVELPYFDGGNDEEQKCAVQARIKLNGASANETVQVAYRVDGSTGAYTNLGTATTSDTERTIRFGTNNVGLAFKAIQPRLSFVRGGTTTLAPKLEYFAIDYIRVPQVLRGYIVRVDCRQRLGERSPRQQIADLWTAVETTTLGTFAYKDDSTSGAANTRSYLVKAARPEGIEATGVDENGVYTLALVSYGAN